MDGGVTFFDALGPLWSICKSQVLKYESRQFYDQTGNESFDALIRGEWNEALRLIPQTRSVDLPLYAELNNKGVDIVRCHPISSPVSDYIKWELENYKYNKAYGGERIYVCNVLALTPMFERSASRDFIIFDARVALIYDYSATGILDGGWLTQSLCEILELMKIFAFVKSQAHPFDRIFQNQLVEYHG